MPSPEICYLTAYDRSRAGGLFFALRAARTRPGCRRVRAPVGEKAVAVRVHCLCGRQPRSGLARVGRGGALEWGEGQALLVHGLSPGSQRSEERRVGKE